MLLRTLCLLVAIVAVTPAEAQRIRVGALEIESPWIEIAVGRSGIAVAHLKITNTADQTDKLYEAISPVAKASELHRAETRDGLTLVRQVRAIDIPGGASLDPAPAPPRKVPRWLGSAPQGRCLSVLLYYITSKITSLWNIFHSANCIRKK